MLLTFPQSYMFLQLVSLGTSPGVAFHDAKLACRQLCHADSLSVQCLVSEHVVSEVVNQWSQLLAQSLQESRMHAPPWEMDEAPPYGVWVVGMITLLAGVP